MANVINATSTGNGGLVSTGDDSGILNIQTNETTAISINASQGVEFLAGTAALPAITTTGDTNTGIFFPAADTIAFSEGGAESMRIDSSGNLLVGCTAVPSASVEGRRIASGSGATTSSSGSSTSAYSHWTFFNGNGNVGTIQTSGSLTSYNVSSDYRLKENIVPLTGALAKITQLKPSVYNYKADPTTIIEGFIAHELQSVIPNAVSGEKDAVDDDGNPIYQGVDVSFLVATLTAALQETKALIDTQAETINALTARIVALEGQ